MKGMKLFVLVGLGLALNMGNVIAGDSLKVAAAGAILYAKMEESLPAFKEKMTNAFDDLKAKGATLKADAERLKKAANLKDQREAFIVYAPNYAEYVGVIGTFLKELNDDLINPLIQFVEAVPGLKNQVPGETVTLPNGQTKTIKFSQKLSGLLSALNAYNEPFEKIADKLPNLIGGGSNAAADEDAATDLGL